MNRQPPQCVIRAAILDTGAVVVDETPRDLVIQPVVAHGALKYAVAEPGADDLPLFRLEDQKFDVRHEFVGFPFKIAFQQQCPHQPVVDVLLNALFPSHAVGALSGGAVQRSETDGLSVR